MIKYMVLFLILFSAGAAMAQSKQTEGSFEKEITKKVSLDYLLYLPPQYDEKENWPLVVFLHGSGERGDDLNKVKIHGIPMLAEKGKEFNFIALSPQCPDHEEWDTDALAALIDDIAENYKVDKDKISLTGLSMGGGGVWNLAVEYPDKFSAIAPVCGVMNRNNPPRAEKIKHLPVWVFHGANDDVVPVSQSARMVAALRYSGNKNVKFTIYEEANHNSWTETYNNPELYEWLISQQRVSVK